MNRSVLSLWLVVLALALVACQGGATSSPDEDEGSASGSDAPAASESDGDTTAAGNDDEALARISEAAEATAEEGTVAFALTLETEGTGGEDGVQPVSVQGEEDFEAQQRRLVFEGPSGELESIIDGTDVYVQIPGTEDDNWARIELPDLLAEDAGFGGPAGLPFASSSDNLAVLSESVSSATEAGEEDLDGDSATRYDVVVDLAEAADESQDDTGTLRAIAEQSGVTELDMQVWVDEEEHIRRVSYALDLSQADVQADLDAEVQVTEGDEATEAGTEVSAQPQGIVTLTLDYSDFGEEVSIELPSDDQIVDIDEDEIRESFQTSSG